MAERIFSGDTAILISAIAQEDEVNLIPVTAVDWSVVNPEGEDVLVSSLPSSPELGDTIGLKILITPFTAWDVVTWDGNNWNVIDSMSPPELVDNTATLVLSGELTKIPGLYQVRAQFTTTEGYKKSDRIWFEAIDPIERTATTPAGIAVERAWTKLEDLFDSELGGPHLRDRTLAVFDKTKMAKLLPDALYRIGATYQPAIVYTEDNFPFDGHSVLASQALLVEAIRHLMRSYVEQPLPVGSNVTYFDRRDYLNRWQTIFQLENDLFILWLDLFKQDQIGFGNTATLVGGYNSPAYRIPRYMRGRYPYQIRY